MAIKLAVLFPGRNYSCDRPLLYYAGKVFEQRGYRIIRLGFNLNLTEDEISKTTDFAPIIERESQSFLSSIKEAFAGIDFAECEDVVFISKSLGTVVAGIADKYFGIHARHIFLTPIKETFQFLRRGRCIVVAGKEDKYLEARKLKIYCVEQDVAIEQFDEVGHSLEHPVDINKTFAILIVIIRMYLQF